MAPTRQPIINLKPTLRGGPLLARVIRTWDVISNLNYPSSFDMLLHDDQGGAIVASVKRDLIPAFKNEMLEGKIYTINNFEVSKNNKVCLPVKNDLIIKFTGLTTVYEEDENEAKIPNKLFNIHPLDRLQERNNKSDYSIDVVGMLTGIEDKKTVNVKGQQTPIRRLQIENLNKLKVPVTLWGAKADLISTEEIQNKTCTLLITSAKVNMFQGKYQLGSTSATQVYINKDIPELAPFKQRLELMEPIQHLEPSQPQTAEDAMFKNRKTVHDILQMIPQEDESFTCNATIIGIHLHKDWNYLSCDACKKKIDQTLYCINCDVVVKYPKTRYLFTVDIDDGTASAPLTLFDKEAEKVVGVPVNKILDLQKRLNGTQMVADRLEHSVGKQFIFKVRLNARGETSELICQKTFEIDFKLENSYKAKQPKEMDKEKGKDHTDPDTPTLLDTGSQTSQITNEADDNNNIAKIREKVGGEKNNNKRNGSELDESTEESRTAKINRQQ